MDNCNTIVPEDKLFQQRLSSIADVPKKLYYIGKIPDPEMPAITIVGTRKPTRYGQEVTYRFAFELAQKGVLIISGLALGTDAIAHKATLEAGGTTVAVMAGGLDHIHPYRHQALAKSIIDGGGALITEYPAGTPSLRHHFIARNRIAAALGEGVLITEATSKSGTLHTANFALEMGRTVMAVPGAITNPMTSGTNGLIKTGATPVTNTDDILFALGYQRPAQQTRLIIAESTEESAILELLKSGVQDGEELLIKSRLQPAVFNQTLTLMEINAKVRALGANKWMLA